MRALIRMLVLAALLAPAVADAAISRVGGCAANTTNCTFSASFAATAGDLIVVFAHRDGVATAPSLPAGFTGTDYDGTTMTSTGSTQAMRLYWKVAAGGETSSGTATNATSLCSVVYRGTDGTKPIGQFAASTGSSATLSFSALTLFSTDNTSWIFGGGGHRTATDVNQAVTGLTVQQTPATADTSCLDSNGTTTGRAASTMSVNATSGWSTGVVEILPADSATSGTCKLAQAAGYVQDLNAATTGTYNYFFSRPTSAGNVLAVVTRGASQNLSISDDQSNVWPAPAVTVNNGAGIAAFVLGGGTSGVRRVSLTLTSGTTSSVGAVLLELYNCKQHLPISVTSSNNNLTAPNLSWSALTTTQANEVVISAAIDASVNEGANLTTATAGSPAEWIFADRNQSTLVQMQVKSTAGSVTPTATVSGTDIFASLALSLKGDDTAGTAPSATDIRIMNSMKFAPGNSQTPAGCPPTCVLTVTTPIRGNTAVIRHIAQGGSGAVNSTLITAMTLGGTTCTEAIQKDEGHVGVSQIWTCPNLTPSLTATASITFSKAFHVSFHNVLYIDDVVNAAVSPLDATASTSGVQSVTGNLTGVSITPTVQPGLAFFIGALNLHCAVGQANAGIYFDGYFNSADDGGDHTPNQCDNQAVSARYTNLTTLNSVWVTQNNPSGVLEWNDIAVTIKEATQDPFPLPFYRRWWQR